MQRSEAVHRAVVEFCRALSAGEVDRFDDHVSVHPAALVIGTAPGEWVTDRAALRFGFETEGVSLSPGPSLTGYAADGLGWAADTPTFGFPDESQMACRATFVLVPEDGRWKIVHMHVSVGVPDDEVVGLQQRWASSG